MIRRLQNSMIRGITSCFQHRRPASSPCAKHMNKLLIKLKAMQQSPKLKYAGYLAHLILLVGIALGLYTRWMLSQDMTVLLFAFLGLFVFAISGAMSYYFSMETVGFCISRLWTGCLLGVIIFTQDRGYQAVSTELVMNILLMASLGVSSAWHLVDRVLKLQTHANVLWDKYELFELLGVGVAAVGTGKQWLPIGLWLAAFWCCVTAVKLKSLWGLCTLVTMATLTGAVFFPRLLGVAVNGYALATFAGRLACEPVLDMYFSGLTTLERWRPLLSKAGYVRQTMVLLLFTVECVLYGLSASLMPSHKEWFVIVPIFAVFSLVWICYHVVFLITCWQFMSKMTQCNATYRGLSEENRNLLRIMSSKGVRHFCLIAQRLCCITFLTSVCIILIGWTTHTGVSLGLAFCVLPCEGAVLSLFFALGASLGGVCAGYAVVAPAVAHRSDGGTTVLPTSALSDVSSKATQTLTCVQRFFAYHLIDTYGCDYSSSGLAQDALQSKLCNFFQRCTSHGPRFDSYMLYYSGHTHPSGDWALAEGRTLKLDQLLEWWRAAQDDRYPARLILLLDTTCSATWLAQVRGLPDVHVALQTWSRGDARDAEDSPAVGDFTAEWMAYNTSGAGEVTWTARGTRPRYAVSADWTDFSFHLPTEEDIASHWNNNFPRATRPLLRVTNLPRLGDVCCACRCVASCLKRARMAWLPPKELDTGHGFKLVRA